ncbi:hypothetical protein [Clostridium sp.]|uniref:hypothetical protein n=1 Tax=Clostridium sp. TaxID=1506 RepID=UPI001A4B7370|nr:hypothetical protein [Clostridium sp.]MBK5234056.1 hypothetical protein [Clostridium sp.]
MRRGETSTVTINTGLILDGAELIVTTFKQGDTIINFTGEQLTIDGSYIQLDLAQADTLQFDSKNTVEVQVKIKAFGKVTLSKITRFRVEEALNEEVI